MKQQLVGQNINECNMVAVEDLVVIVCTEFVKQYADKLQVEDDYHSGKTYIPYLRMNYKARRKLAEKLLDILLPENN